MIIGGKGCLTGDKHTKKTINPNLCIRSPAAVYSTWLCLVSNIQGYSNDCRGFNNLSYTIHFR
jgi:hypothetical protein